MTSTPSLSAQIKKPERPSAVVAAACIVGDWQDRHELADNLPAAVLDDLKLSIRRALQQHERLETRPVSGEIVERVAAAMWEHNHDGAWPDDAEPVALNIYRGDAAIAINVICRALLGPQMEPVNPGSLPSTDTAPDKPEDAERGLGRDG